MKKPIISMIACIGKNREIGKNNELIWRFPEDMQRFRSLTTGHTVIMGQNTFESIGMALPHRENIVLTRDDNFKPRDCRVCHSVEQAMEIAREVEKEEIFIIGGGQIYNQFVSLSDKLYLTVVEQKRDADVFFPEYGEFIVCKTVGGGVSSEGIKYKFLEITKDAKKG